MNRRIIADVCKVSPSTVKCEACSWNEKRRCRFWLRPTVDDEDFCLMWTNTDINEDKDLTFYFSEGEDYNESGSDQSTSVSY